MARCEGAGLWRGVSELAYGEVSRSWFVAMCERAVLFRGL